MASRLSIDRGGFHYPSERSWVFRNLSIDVGPRETIRVVGRNGVGKSTLLRVLSGLLDLSEGTLTRAHNVVVSYMDQLAGNMLASDLTIREQFAVVTDAGALAPAMAGLIDFGLGLQSRPTAFVGHLSSGERQIVALLCTLAGGANVLCLDEFTAALDVKSLVVAKKILARVRELSDATLILVSHSDDAVLRIDRTIELTGQTVEQDGERR